MSRRLIKIFFVLFLALIVQSAIYQVTEAASTSGYCGNNTYWSYSNGTLKISGNGAMYDYSYDWQVGETKAPWRPYISSIKKVVVENGVTTIGVNAFSALTNVTSITLPSSLKTIKSEAFSFLFSLRSLYMPYSVTSISSDAFRGSTLNMTYSSLQITKKNYGANLISWGSNYDVYPDEGIYRINANYSGNYSLDISGDSKADRANIQIYESSDSDVQKFKLVRHSDYYTIQSVYSGKWLDIRTPISNGSNVQLWNSCDSIEEKWTFVATDYGSVRIKSLTGYYLSVDGGNRNNANVFVESYNNLEDRSWFLEEYYNSYYSQKIDVEEGIYEIVSAYCEDFALDISGNSTADRANIQLYRKDGSVVQKFRIKKDGDYYVIQSLHSGKWLDIRTPITAGSNVQLWNSNSSEEEKWEFYEALNGYVYIKSKTGYYLSIEGYARNNANVFVDSFENNFQGWKLNKTDSEPTNKINVDEGVYEIASSLNSGYVFDISSNSKADRANIQVYSRENTKVQRYKIIKDGDYYVIKSLYSGKWLDIRTPITNESNVQLWNSNSSIEEKWQFYEAGNGNVYIKSKTGYYVNLDGYAHNNANVNVAIYNGSNNQKWTLKRDYSYDVNEPSTMASIQEGIYEIASEYNSYYVLDISGNSTADRANIQLYARENTKVQRYKIVKNGNYYNIQSLYSGKWLDIRTPISDGSNVQLWNSRSSEEEQWQFYEAGNGCVYIKSKTGYYLNLSGYARNNANVEVADYNGSSNQKWILNKDSNYNISEPTSKVSVKEGVYEILCASNKNFSLDISSDSRDNRANIQIFQRNSTLVQKFKVIKSGDSYIIKNLFAGKWLDIRTPISDGSNVQLWESYDSIEEKWQFYDAGNGNYYIKSNTGYYLTSTGQYNNANVYVDSFTNTQITKWYLSSVTDSTYTSEISRIPLTKTTDTYYGSAFSYDKICLSSGYTYSYSNLNSVLNNQIMADKNQIASVCRSYRGYWIEKEIVRSDTNIVSIYSDDYVFSGGAHGDNIFTCVNYNPSTGEILEIEDIVTNMSKFLQLLDSKYYSINNSEPERKSFASDSPSQKYYSQGKGSLIFTVDNDGITVYYGNYTLYSSYVFMDEFYITFSELSGCIKDKYVMSP